MGDRGQILVHLQKVVFSTSTLPYPYPTTLPYSTLTPPYITLPYPILPYPYHIHVLSYPYPPTLPFPTLPLPTLSYPTLPYPPTLPYHTLPCPTLPLSYTTLAYPTLAYRGGAVTWWLTPRTPDLEVGGLSPTRVAVLSLIKTYLHPKVLVIPRKRWLHLNMTEQLLTGTLSIKQPYPTPTPHHPTHPSLPYTLPYPTLPYSTPAHPTPPHPIPTLPYPLRIHTHAHNQASHSQAMLSYNSSYYCFFGLSSTHCGITR